MENDCEQAVLVSYFSGDCIFPSAGKVTVQSAAIIINRY